MLFMHCYAYTCNHVQGALLPAVGERSASPSPAVSTLGSGRVDAREGCRAVHLHRRHRASTTSRHRTRCRAALPRTARRPRGWSIAAPPWSRRGSRLWPAGLPHPLAVGPISTPPRSAGPLRARCWCGRCSRTTCRSGRRLHLQGQRHRAVYRYGCSPTKLADLQTVARRHLRSASLAAARRCPSGCSPAACRTGQHEKAYSTDANIWGATHEAKSLEHLDACIEIVDPIMGVPFWGPLRRDRHGGCHRSASKQGRPSAINGKEFASPVDLVLEANAIGGRHGWACPTRSRTGSSRPRAGHLRGARHGLLHASYERLVNAIHNEEHPGQLPHRGRRLGRSCTRAAGWTRRR